MAIDPDVQVIIDVIAQRVADLENGSTNVDLSDLTARVSALESAINVPVNPHTVIQQYDDNSEIIYKKE